MPTLETHIQSYFGIATEDIAKIADCFKRIELNKGEFYLKANHVSDRLGFVESGVLREFVQMPDKEVTKWVSTPGYFVVDLSSFLFNQTSRWNIQAISDCVIHVIEKKEYEKLNQLVAQWPELEKRFLAKCFTVLEDRLMTFLSMNAEQRYQFLYNFNKDLFVTVPLNYLASMMGMSPETLSRLRNK
jgi:CRP/FNR family transcriptional regulator, anaerobic regulatory protein